MFRFVFPFTAFLFLASQVFTQGVNNLWLMGKDSHVGLPFGGIKMDFNGGILNIGLESRRINLECTSGVISNSTGELLFISNGVFIQNSVNDTMLNGFGLNPSPFTTLHSQYGLTLPQANLVIPFPIDTSRFYLFHETIDDYGNFNSPLYLYYSVIDTTLDGGKGGVIQKNTVLVNDTLDIGGLTACKHANGRDWWLVFHRYNSDIYYKFLISPFGINGAFIQNTGIVRGNYPGQSVFSHDGRMYATYDPVVDLDIYDFDRCTGELTLREHIEINDSAYAGGVAFSANSQMLYVSSMYYVYQFDLTSANISMSQTTVAVYDGYFSPQPPFASVFYLSRLAPDGKIYINSANSSMDLHVINYPDSSGFACAVCQHCVHLSAVNSFTLPNYPNYYLGAESGSICDSLQTNVNDILLTDKTLKIFPTPVTGNIISLNYPVLPVASELKIYNIEGKVVSEYGLPPWSSVLTISYPQLLPGIYLAVIRNSEINLNTKFVIE